MREGFSILVLKFVEEWKRMMDVDIVWLLYSYFKLGRHIATCRIPLVWLYWYAPRRILELALISTTPLLGQASTILYLSRWFPISHKFLHITLILPGSYHPHPGEIFFPPTPQLQVYSYQLHLTTTSQYVNCIQSEEDGKECQYQAGNWNSPW